MAAVGCTAARHLERQPKIAILGNMAAIRESRWQCGDWWQNLAVKLGS